VVLLDEISARIQPLDEGAMQAARTRHDQLTKPPGSLGRLEELSIRLAGITGVPCPVLRRKTVIVMAGDHGVTAEAVSAYPSAVTAQMVMNFLRGGAAINVLARQAGARVLVVDAGVASELGSHPGLLQRKVACGTANIAHGPAMSRAAALQAINAGIEAVTLEIERGVDLLAVGEMGIGNTTPSAAIAAALTGVSIDTLVGRGTGIDDVTLAHKIDIVTQALEVNQPDQRDPLDVLAKLGGFEIAALVGAILAAAAGRLPVMLDGYITGAAALVAVGIAPQVQPYLLASHRSHEQGHQAILKALGLQPLLELEMRLGEGTGAVLTMYLVEAAVRLLGEMATFTEAGVSDRG